MDSFWQKREKTEDMGNGSLLWAIFHEAEEHILSWKLIENLRQRLKSEEGYYVFPAGLRERFALVYPNSYFVGMSNLGLHIIYALLNERADTACERFFLPERKEKMEYVRSRTPLLSLETQTPLSEFPIIAFAVSFEMDYFNILSILELGRVSLLAEERGEDAPLVIAGGPCATFNPEPLSLFVDAFIIGEGEETMQQFMDIYYDAKKKGASRSELLKALAGVQGVYIPSLYRHVYAQNGTLAAIEPLPGAPSRVYRQWVHDLDAYPAHTVVTTENTEFNLYLIETARGCGRHCRFCMAGYCFRRPRNRSLPVIEKMVHDARHYKKRIGLMGAAISDYPEIDMLCRDILGEGLSMSVASFRVDSVTKELVDSLSSSGLKTLTMAPEAGSKRMRAIINKGIEEEHLFKAMELGLAAGIRNFRLYFMIGLPMETPEDVQAIIQLAYKLRDYMDAGHHNGMLTLSINPFVPKPFTPFQWLPMAGQAEVQDILKILRTAVKPCKNIDIIAESPRESYVQGILARGDRRISQVLYAAQQAGGVKFFQHTLRGAGLNEDFYLYRRRAEEEIFPWDILDIGCHREYLYEELIKAETLQPTLQCFDGCRRCGVCSG